LVQRVGRQRDRFEIVVFCELEECLMDFVVAGIIALLLLAYLTYAMFNPEKFN
jgi:K+-transporting ATPase KdpF subunit